VQIAERLKSLLPQWCTHEVHLGKGFRLTLPSGERPAESSDAHAKWRLDQRAKAW
jgi:hypothetical protein